MTSSGDVLETLNASVTSTLTLLSQLDATVSSIAAHPQPSASTTQELQPVAPAVAPIDALSLAHDSSALIKAHATKISLLIINEPYTPTAIAKVLQELVTSPIPGLAAAVEACTPERYTLIIQQDLAWRAGRVFKELKELLSRIPKDGKVLVDGKKSASAGAAGGKGSIAATGVLWSACDDLMAFAKRGFAGNLAHRVEQLRDTLKDVMDELKEWGEETEDDEDDEGDGQSDAGGDGVAHGASDFQSGSVSPARDAQAILDDLMNSQRYIPRDDPDKIRERLDSCLKRLRLTTLLYQAAVKRRIKPLSHLPPDSLSDIPARLDEVMSVLKRIPERFGSVAMAFYELDRSEIDRLMDECFFDAFAASELLVNPWEGQKDEFSDWALRFQIEIKKG
ncbi:hypothetical protein C8A05DRAFT_42661 [Staphylotrichum tortipilum]|uniref:Cyclin-D1-binding protein 1-like N-terminal domain-containing protein n=1 Tax=Staphylotrichum tortipilum TaxID=2831512 RepID=A0AAN6MNK9_9PEZI|nr:hypothetical protein C8A05DRAFT_42661 [Staphylotrichum longicolle]